MPGPRVVPRLGKRGLTYIQKVLGYNPIAYWPLWEAAGPTAQCLVNPAQNGTYTGVTLGQPGIGDGNTCPLFDGTNDFVNVHSAALAGVFSGVAGTVIIWAKIFNAGVWTDGTYRWPFSFAADDNNRAVAYRRMLVNGRLASRYEAAGTDLGIISDAHAGLLTWMPFAMTWDKNAGGTGEVKHYYAGAQEGATQVGLGVWAGALSNTQTVIGASKTTPSDLWYGWLGHCVAWDSAQPVTTIADLATV